MLSKLNEAELVLLDGLQDLLQNRVFDVLMPLITFFGDAGWIWIAIGVLLLCFRKHRRAGVTMLVGLLCSLLIGNLFLKLSVARERPCWINEAVTLLIETPTDYSFPSGHTLASFIGATVLWLYNKRWGYIAFPCAALIAFSRLYLYVHYPTDVLAGILLGIAIGCGVTHLIKRLFLIFEMRQNHETDPKPNL